MNFDDKVIIITGATGGIGAEAARTFAKRGAKLVLVDLDLKKLEELKDELKLNDNRVLIKACDVRNESLVKDYVNAAILKFKKIDVFVNNAGVEGAVKPIQDSSSDDIDFVLDINIKGAYYGLKYVLPVMYYKKVVA